MKKFLLLFLFLLSTPICYADYFYNNPHIITKPHHNKIYGKKIIQAPPTNINHIPNLELMENALFNRNYTNENLNSRLTRLEENFFGQQVNGTIGERYRNLSEAFQSPTYTPLRQQYQPQYKLPPYSPETSQKLGLINRLANFLGGTATGITPSMNDYGFQDSYQTPYGYGFFNQSRGSGVGIRILD